MSDQRPLHLFLHLPKTAGTTFKTHVRNRYGRDELLLLYHDRRSRFGSREGIRAHLAEMGPERRDRLELLFGHAVFWGLHELFPEREPRYVTFLRDPVAQTFSRYAYGLRILGSLHRFRNPKFARELTDGGRVLSLSEWLEANPRHHDFMFRFLYSHLFDVPHRQVEPGEETFAELEERLASFHFLGLLEQPEDHLFLYHELGVERFFGRRNVSRDRPAPDPHDIEAVRASHRWDLRLYELGRRLNAEARARHPRFEAAVAAVRRRREAQGELAGRLHAARDWLRQRADRAWHATAFALSRLRRSGGRG